MSAKKINQSEKPGFIDKAIDAVEDISVFIGSIFGTHANGYCDIETSDGPDILVTKAGSLVSAVEIRGVNHLVGSEEFENIMSSLDRAFAPLLSRAGHVIQVWFQHDPESTRDLLKHVTRPARATAKRLKLDLEDIIESKVDHLSKYCSDERIVIGLWTTSAILTKQTAERVAKKKTAEMASAPRQLFTPGTQRILSSTPDIREHHLSALKNLHGELVEMGFYCEMMSAHEMVREIRRSVSPSVTSHDWKATLPGDPVPRPVRSHYVRDVGDIGYPTISSQVFPKDLERHPNGRYLNAGDRTYAPLFIEVPATEIHPFSKLYGLLSSAKMPWRISFILEPEGVKSVGLKSSMASVLVWSSSINRSIDDSVRALKEAEFDGEVVVRGRVSLCTWAPKNNPDLLEDCSARLSKALSSWGRAEVRDVVGDPMLGFISSCPLISLKSAANAFVAPLSDVIRQLPVDRLASAWSAGGVILRTKDGRVIPFEPGSSLQTTSNYLFFARPGMGKSVLMASINLASCIKAGIDVLPYVSYIDIGPSSRGFIELIQDALPANLKHYAAYFKLRMLPDYAVNPFDTQLGLRYPLPDELTTLKSFLTLLATPAESSSPYDSMSALCSKVIEEAYKIFSDGPKSKPKVYTSGMNDEIDRELELMKVYPEKGTPWWEIVDLLFKEGNSHLASIAQRYAVPTLADVAAIASQPAIADLYGKVTINTGESLNLAFSRILADKIRDFPILASETRFDIGEARVISIDLNEVAKSGKTNVHQNGIVYMLARLIVSKHFRLDEDAIKEVPSLYLDYYKKKVAEVRSTMKWIIYDEFHRTSSVSEVRDTVLVDMREGRKWNLGVMLASQSVDDFDKTMKEFSSGVFILNAANTSTANELQTLFGFNDTAKQMLLTEANGPTEKGAPFLAQISTNSGNSSQFLISSISPIEAWAFSTTAEDVTLRSKLYEQVGQVNARKLLAAEFPGGSAKREIERLRNEMKDSNDESAATNGAIDKVLRRLIDRFAQQNTTSRT